jgi:hypothetical protein
MSPQSRVRLVSVAIAIVVGLSPIAISLGAGYFAAFLGCELDEGNPHRCMFRGRNIGESLYAWGMAGLYCIVTVPVSAALIVVYNLVMRARIMPPADFGQSGRKGLR